MPGTTSMLLQATRMNLFRKLAIYTVLSYLGVTILRSIPSGDQRDNNTRREGLDWFTVYREDKNQHVRMSLRYHPPHEARTFHMGRQFRVPRQQAKSIAESFAVTFDLTEKSVTQIVFLTAISEDHFDESTDAIAAVQHHFPDHKLVLYDLGLSSKQAKQVKTWCHVIFRQFNYTAYPPHVKILKKYAWKPLLMQEVARDYGAFFWFDSSTRFNTGNISSLHQTALANGGIAFIKYAPHSNFASTYKKTYEFVTTDMERQKAVQQVSSGAILYYNTDKMYYNVLWWWVLCALDPYCMAPIFWTPCDFKNHDRYKEYAACHRFDQSVINLLVSNLFGYESKTYTSPSNITFVRIQTFSYKLLVCTGQSV